MRWRCSPSPAPRSPARSRPARRTRRCGPSSRPTWRSSARRIGRPPDRAILGCTHYEIIADLFRAALPPGTPLIHQPGATADALQRYLARHPEYALGDTGARRFLTTGRPGPQNGLAARFWGEPLTFEAA